MIRDELITYDTNRRDAYGNHPIIGTREIVRCRDCKLHVNEGRILYCDLNTVGFPEVEPDGYCAWGKRMSE